MEKLLKMEKKRLNMTLKQVGGLVQWEVYDILA